MLKRIANGMKSFRAWAKDSKEPEMKRNAQETVDTVNMYHYTSQFKNMKNLIRNNPEELKRIEAGLSKEELEYLAEADAGTVRGYHEKRERVMRMLDVQVYDMFSHVIKIGGKVPYPKPIYHKSEYNPEKDEDVLFLEKKMNTQTVEQFNPGEDLEHPEGFSLIVRKSNIDHPESGYGVFVNGTILPGTVVAFYPGTAYFPYDLTEKVLDGNDYLIARYDSTVIDGRSWDRRYALFMKRAQHLAFSAGTKINEDELRKFKNPFGIANYINHPPKGQQANVMVYSYDFPADTPMEILPYIPNDYFKEPNFVWGKPDCIRHSVVCVAKRLIKDEELFLNYRYNPAHPYPDWYAQPDEMEAKRRWSKMTVFS